MRIHWPVEKCRLLGEEVVIIDSPGIDVEADLDDWIDRSIVLYLSILYTIIYYSKLPKSNYLSISICFSILLSILIDIPGIDVKAALDYWIGRSGFSINLSLAINLSIFFVNLHKYYIRINVFLRFFNR